MGPEDTDDHRFRLSRSFLWLFDRVLLWLTARGAVEVMQYKGIAAVVVAAMVVVSLGAQETPPAGGRGAGQGRGQSFPPPSRGGGGGGGAAGPADKPLLYFALADKTKESR